VTVSAAAPGPPSASTAGTTPGCASPFVGVGLTQIGEFSFILVQVSRAAGHVGEDVYSATLAASLLSILLNALLMRHVPRWLAAGGRSSS
jgi:predicted Kef-type K+ transport protein